MAVNAHGYGYPYYGSYGYSYPSYTPYPDVGSSPTYDPGYSGYEGDVTPSYPDGYQAYYPPDAAPAQPDNTAHVIVSLPSDAELLFDGTKTTSAGSVREYQSPPLTPGRRYTYELRARWSENGQEVTQTQQVGVTAGAHVNVSFPVPAKPTGAAVK